MQLYYTDDINKFCNFFLISREKLGPLVIGKSAKSRCYSLGKKERPGVHYEANQNAWITAEIFST